ncbi:hypothetical protein ACVDFE_31375 [Lentzea chajnantorensis]
MVHHVVHLDPEHDVDQTHWTPGQGPLASAHEVGHMFGLVDETGGANRPTVEGTLMGRHQRTGPDGVPRAVTKVEVPSRYLSVLSRVIGPVDLLADVPRGRVTADLPTGAVEPRLYRGTEEKGAGGRRVRFALPDKEPVKKPDEEQESGTTPEEQTPESAEQRLRDSLPQYLRDSRGLGAAEQIDVLRGDDGARVEVEQALRRLAPGVKHWDGTAELSEGLEHAVAGAFQEYGSRPTVKGDDRFHSLEVKATAHWDRVVVLGEAENKQVASSKTKTSSSVEEDGTRQNNLSPPLQFTGLPGVVVQVMPTIPAAPVEQVSSEQKKELGRSTKVEHTPAVKADVPVTLSFRLFDEDGRRVMSPEGEQEVEVSGRVTLTVPTDLPTKDDAGRAVLHEEIGPRIGDVVGADIAPVTRADRERLVADDPVWQEKQGDETTRLPELTGLPRGVATESAVVNNPGTATFAEQVLSRLQPRFAKATALGSDGREVVEEFFSESTIAENLPKMAVYDGEADPEKGWVASPPIFKGRGRGFEWRPRSTQLEMRAVARWVRVDQVRDKVKITERTHAHFEHSGKYAVKRKFALSGFIGGGGEPIPGVMAAGGLTGSASVERNASGKVSGSTAGKQALKITGDAVRYEMVYDIEVRQVGKEGQRPWKLDGNVTALHWTSRRNAARVGLAGPDPEDGGFRGGADRTVQGPPEFERGKAILGVVEEVDSGRLLEQALVPLLHDVPLQRRWYVSSSMFVRQFTDGDVEDGRLTAKAVEAIQRGRSLAEALDENEIARLTRRLSDGGLLIPVRRKGWFHDYRTTVTVTARVSDIEEGDPLTADELEEVYVGKATDGIESGGSRSAEVGGGPQLRFMGLLPGSGPSTTAFGVLLFGVRGARNWSKETTFGSKAKRRVERRKGDSLTEEGKIGDRAVRQFKSTLTIDFRVDSERRHAEAVRRIIPGRSGRQLPTHAEMPRVPGEISVEMRTLVPEVLLAPGNPFDAEPAAPVVPTPTPTLPDPPAPHALRPPMSHRFDDVEIVSFHGAEKLQQAALEVMSAASGHDPVVRSRTGVIAQTVSEELASEKLTQDLRLFSDTLVIDSAKKLHGRRVHDLFGSWGVTFAPRLSATPVTAHEYQQVVREVQGTSKVTGVGGPTDSFGGYVVGVPVLTDRSLTAGEQGTHAMPRGILVLLGSPYSGSDSRSDSGYVETAEKLSISELPQKMFLVRLDVDATVVAEAVHKNNLTFGLTAPKPLTRAGEVVHLPESVLAWVTADQLAELATGTPPAASRPDGTLAVPPGLSPGRTEGQSVGLGGISRPIDLRQHVDALRDELARHPAIGADKAGRLLPDSTLDPNNVNIASVKNFLSDANRMVNSLINGGQVAPNRLEDRFHGETYELVIDASFTEEPSQGAVRNVAKLKAGVSAELGAKGVTSRVRTLFTAIASSRAAVVVRNPGTTDPSSGQDENAKPKRTEGQAGAGPGLEGIFGRRELKKSTEERTKYSQSATVEGPVAVHTGRLDVTLRVQRHGRDYGSVEVTEEAEVTKLAEEAFPPPVRGGRFGSAEADSGVRTGPLSDEDMAAWRTTLPDGTPVPPMKDLGAHWAEHYFGDIDVLRRDAVDVLRAAGVDITPKVLRVLRTAITPTSVRAAFQAALDGRFVLSLHDGLDHDVEIHFRPSRTPRFASTSAGVRIDAQRVRSEETEVGFTSGNEAELLNTAPFGALGQATSTGSGKGTESGTKPFRSPFDAKGASTTRTTHTALGPELEESELSRTDESRSAEPMSSETRTDEKLTRALVTSVDTRVVARPRTQHGKTEAVAYKDRRVHDAFAVRMYDTNATRLTGRELPDQLVDSTTVLAEKAEAWLKAERARIAASDRVEVAARPLEAADQRRSTAIVDRQDIRPLVQAQRELARERRDEFTRAREEWKNAPAESREHHREEVKRRRGEWAAADAALRRLVDQETRLARVIAQSGAVTAAHAATVEAERAAVREEEKAKQEWWAAKAEHDREIAAEQRREADEEIAEEVSDEEVAEEEVAEEVAEEEVTPDPAPEVEEQEAPRTAAPDLLSHLDQVGEVDRRWGKAPQREVDALRQEARRIVDRHVRRPPLFIEVPAQENLDHDAIVTLVAYRRYQELRGLVGDGDRPEDLAAHLAAETGTQVVEREREGLPGGASPAGPAGTAGSPSTSPYAVVTYPPTGNAREAIALVSDESESDGWPQRVHEWLGEGDWTATSSAFVLLEFEDGHAVAGDHLLDADTAGRVVRDSDTFRSLDRELPLRVILLFSSPDALTKDPAGEVRAAEDFVHRFAEVVLADAPNRPVWTRVDQDQPDDLRTLLEPADLLFDREYLTTSENVVSGPITNSTGALIGFDVSRARWFTPLPGTVPTVHAERVSAVVPPGRPRAEGRELPLPWAVLTEPGRVRPLVVALSSTPEPGHFDLAVGQDGRMLLSTPRETAEFLVNRPEFLTAVTGPEQPALVLLNRNVWGDPQQALGLTAELAAELSRATGKTFETHTAAGEIGMRTDGVTIVATGVLFGHHPLPVDATSVFRSGSVFGLPGAEQTGPWSRDTLQAFSDAVESGRFVVPGPWGAARPFFVAASGDAAGAARATLGDGAQVDVDGAWGGTALLSDQGFFSALTADPTRPVVIVKPHLSGEQDFGTFAFDLVTRLHESGLFPTVYALRGGGDLTTIADPGTGYTDVSGLRAGDLDVTLVLDREGDPRALVVRTLGDDDFFAQVQAWAAAAEDDSLWFPRLPDGTPVTASWSNEDSTPGFVLVRTGPVGYRASLRGLRDLDVTPQVMMTVLRNDLRLRFLLGSGPTEADGTGLVEPSVVFAAIDGPVVGPDELATGLAGGGYSRRIHWSGGRMGFSSDGSVVVEVPRFDSAATPPVEISSLVSHPKKNDLNGLHGVIFPSADFDLVDDVNDAGRASAGYRDFYFSSRVLQDSSGTGANTLVPKLSPFFGLETWYAGAHGNRSAVYAALPGNRPYLLGDAVPLDPRAAAAVLSGHHLFAQAHPNTTPALMLEMCFVGGVEPGDSGESMASAILRAWRSVAPQRAVPRMFAATRELLPGKGDNYVVEDGGDIVEVVPPGGRARPPVELRELAANDVPAVTAAFDPAGTDVLAGSDAEIETTARAVVRAAAWRQLRLAQEHWVTAMPAVTIVGGGTSRGPVHPQTGGLLSSARVVEVERRFRAALADEAQDMADRGMPVDVDHVRITTRGPQGDHGVGPHEVRIEVALEARADSDVVSTGNQESIRELFRDRRGTAIGAAFPAMSNSGSGRATVAVSRAAFDGPSRTVDRSDGVRTTRGGDTAPPVALLPRPATPVPGAESDDSGSDTASDAGSIPAGFELVQPPVTPALRDVVKEQLAQASLFHVDPVSNQLSDPAEQADLAVLRSRLATAVTLQQDSGSAMPVVLISGRPEQTTVVAALLRDGQAVDPSQPAPDVLQLAVPSTAVSVVVDLPDWPQGHEHAPTTAAAGGLSFGSGLPDEPPWVFLHARQPVNPRARKSFYVYATLVGDRFLVRGVPVTPATLASRVRNSPAYRRWVTPATPIRLVGADPDRPEASRRAAQEFAEALWHAGSRHLVSAATDPLGLGPSNSTVVLNDGYYEPVSQVRPSDVGWVPLTRNDGGLVGIGFATPGVLDGDVLRSMALSTDQSQRLVAEELKDADGHVVHHYRAGKWAPATTGARTRPVTLVGEHGQNGYTLPLVDGSTLPVDAEVAAHMLAGSALFRQATAGPVRPQLLLFTHDESLPTGSVSGANAKLLATLRDLTGPVQGHDFGGRLKFSDEGALVIPHDARVEESGTPTASDVVSVAGGPVTGFPVAGLEAATIQDFADALRTGRTEGPTGPWAPGSPLVVVVDSPDGTFVRVRSKAGAVLELGGGDLGRLWLSDSGSRAALEADPSRPVVLLANFAGTEANFGQLGFDFAGALHEAGFFTDVYAPDGAVEIRDDSVTHDPATEFPLVSPLRAGDLQSVVLRNRDEVAVAVYLRAPGDETEFERASQWAENVTADTVQSFRVAQGSEQSPWLDRLPVFLIASSGRRGVQAVRRDQAGVDLTPAALAKVMRADDELRAALNTETGEQNGRGVVLLALNGVAGDFDAFSSVFAAGGYSRWTYSPSGVATLHQDGTISLQSGEFLSSPPSKASSADVITRPLVSDRLGEHGQYFPLTLVDDHHMSAAARHSDEVELQYYLREVMTGPGGTAVMKAYVAPWAGSSRVPWLVDGHGAPRGLMFGLQTDRPFVFGDTQTLNGVDSAAVVAGTTLFAAAAPDSDTPVALVQCWLNSSISPTTPTAAELFQRELDRNHGSQVFAATNVVSVHTNNAVRAVKNEGSFTAADPLAPIPEVPLSDLVAYRIDDTTVQFDPGQTYLSYLQAADVRETARLVTRAAAWRALKQAGLPAVEIIVHEMPLDGVDRALAEARAEGIERMFRAAVAAESAQLDRLGLGVDPWVIGVSVTVDVATPGSEPPARVIVTLPPEILGARQLAAVEARPGFPQAIHDMNEAFAPLARRGSATVQSPQPVGLGSGAQAQPVRRGPAVDENPSHHEVATRSEQTASPVDLAHQVEPARPRPVVEDERWRHSRAEQAPWFDPQDAPLRPSDWEHLRAGAGVRTVDTELFDPARGWLSRSGPAGYVQRVRYDVRRIEVGDRHVRELTVRLRPVGDIAPDLRLEVEADVQRGLDTIANAGYRLPGGDQLHVRVEFAGPHELAHSDVDIRPRGDDDASRQTRWRSDDREALAHEVLHFVGLVDEHVDPHRVFLADDSRSRVVADDGPMGPAVHDGLPVLKPRHAWMIERTMVSQLGPVEGWNPVRPDRTSPLVDPAARTADAPLPRNRSVPELLRSISDGLTQLDRHLTALPGAFGAELRDRAVHWRQVAARPAETFPPTAADALQDRLDALDALLTRARAVRLRHITGIYDRARAVVERGGNPLGFHPAGIPGGLTASPEARFGLEVEFETGVPEKIGRRLEEQGFLRWDDGVRFYDEAPSASDGLYRLVAEHSDDDGAELRVTGVARWQGSVGGPSHRAQHRAAADRRGR